MRVPSVREEDARQLHRSWETIQHHQHDNVSRPLPMPSTIASPVACTNRNSTLVTLWSRDRWQAQVQHPLERIVRVERVDRRFAGRRRHSLLLSALDVGCQLDGFRSFGKVGIVGDENLAMLQAIEILPSAKILFRLSQ